MCPHPDPDVTSGERVPRTLPPQLLRPTYQNRLRAIGRDLDVRNCRSVLVLEVEGGFVVRTVRRSDRDIELVQYTDDSFPERMIVATEARGRGERQDRTSVVIPTGYEDVLRAIGRRIDNEQVRHVAIAETRTAIVVTGDRWAGDEPVHAMEWRLDIAGVKDLLDQSFRLRSRDDRRGDR